MLFTLQQFEILRRRNKENDPCIPDEENFDQIVLNDHLENVGCKAPFQISNKSWNICDSKEKMKEASTDLIGRQKSRKACTSAATTFNYGEYDWGNQSTDFVGVQIVYPDQYKEIRMIKDISPGTLISAIGGYVGLFLGNFLETLLI